MILWVCAALVDEYVYLSDYISVFQGGQIFLRLCGNWDIWSEAVSRVCGDQKTIVWFRFQTVRESTANIKGVNTVSRVNRTQLWAGVGGTPSLIAFVNVSTLKQHNPKQSLSLNTWKFGLQWSDLFYKQLPQDYLGKWHELGLSFYALWYNIQFVNENWSYDRKTKRNLCVTGNFIKIRF